MQLQQTICQNLLMDIFTIARGFTLQLLKTKRFVIRGFLHGPFTSGGDKVPPYTRPPIYFGQGRNIYIELTDSLTQIVSQFETIITNVWCFHKTMQIHQIIKGQIRKGCLFEWFLFSESAQASKPKWLCGLRTKIYVPKPDLQIVSATAWPGRPKMY